MYRKTICVLLICALLMGNFLATPVSANASSPEVEVYYSSYNDLDLQYTLTNMTTAKNLSFVSSWSTIPDGTTGIVVDPSVRYQTWEGFGGSLDGATIYHLNKLDEADYAQALNDLFHLYNGNAYDLMRLCIGCSDFTIDAIEAAIYGPYNGEGDGEYWTYNDIVDEDTDGDGIFDADTDLSGFSIQGDIDANVISTIKDILEINPDVRFFASMWSAPAWMKKNESIIWESGQVQPELKDEYYDVLAEYYCKFIKAYEEEGISIAAVTLQNEPDVKVGYPCMIFTPENQIKFATILGKAFEKQNITTEIWGMDANEFETWAYAVPLLESDAAEYVDGIGFHNYGGISMYYPKSLTQQYPNVSMHITEMTVGANKLVEYMRNDINTYSYWITYYDLDMQNRTYGPGPSFWSKPQSDDADHWSLSQISDNSSGGYQKNAKYYVFGQFSRFIKNGAVRISSSDANGNISNVAFQNPDGSISLIVVNRASASNTNYDPNTPAQVIQIMTPDGMLQDTIPGDTVATYRWNPEHKNAVTKYNWSAMANAVYDGYSAYQAIDGIAETLWLTGSNQTSGQELMLDLGATTAIAQLSLNTYDSFADDYPGSFQVFTSPDKTNWTSAGTGSGSPGVTNISFAQQIETRYVKIVLTSGKNNWWSINEIAIYNDSDSTGISNRDVQMLADKSGWTVQASSNRVSEEFAAQAVDGNIETSWIHQGAQVTGKYLVIDLGNTASVDYVVIDSGVSQDYGRAYTCHASSDNEQWANVGTVTVTPQITAAGSIAGTKAVVNLPDNTLARYVKIELAQDTLDHWWEIAEISIYQDIAATTLDRIGWFAVSELDNWFTVSYEMFDGNEQTRWTNNKAQEIGDSVNFDMSSLRSFDQIVIQSGSDYARGLKVMTSVDGSVYEEIAQCENGSEVTTITFDTIQKAKCIRLELTQPYDYAWWSIYELNLSCSKEESSETKTATTWNHGVELERRAIDGDISTYWESAEMQSVSEAYTTAYLLNLGSAQSISGIAINTGSQMWNYLDTYEVYAWTDGEEALLVAKGSAQTAVTEVFFETVNAKYIWIKAGSAASQPFVIAELDVYV